MELLQGLLLKKYKLLKIVLIEAGTPLTQRLINYLYKELPILLLELPCEHGRDTQKGLERDGKQSVI
jgi:hypothetical protein